MSNKNWIFWIIGIVVVILILWQLNIIHLGNLFSTVGESVPMISKSGGGAISSTVP